MTPTGWLIRDGLRLAVHDAGGDGTPVLFQHGLCGDARQTTEVFPLSPGYRRVTLECRGHGASATGPDLSIATFADDIAALAEQLGAPLVMGGISMGAAIATRVAVTRPDLVRGLILVRPAWVTEAAPVNMAPNAEVGALLSRMPADDARQVFATSATAMRLARDAPDNLASLMGFFDRQPQNSTARLLTAVSSDGPGISDDDLRRLTLPALVCGTGEDAIHPLSHAKRLTTLIAAARFVELPPKGRDKPAYIAALRTAIAGFLKEL